VNTRRLLALFAASSLLFGAHSAFAQTDAPPASGTPSPKELKHPSPEDKLLIKSVRRKLARTGGLDPSNVSVLAHSGVVVLTGTVRTQGEADLAASSASQVPDVTSVVNKLTIRAPM
jgi:osmotically-inducible protein OsmY